MTGYVPTCVYPACNLDTHCLYSSESTCSSHGDVSDDGICTCHNPYHGDNCELGGTASPTALVTFSPTIPEPEPTPAPTDSPTGLNCNGGTTGSECQYSAELTCGGRGTVSFGGVCTCDAGWDPSWSIMGYCARCLPGFVPLPLQCVDSAGAALDAYGDGCAAYTQTPSYCDHYVRQLRHLFLGPVLTQFSAPQVHN